MPLSNTASPTGKSVRARINEQIMLTRDWELFKTGLFPPKRKDALCKLFVPTHYKKYLRQQGN
jgi:hypothetical protein